ncbi:glutamate receptor ionotropic, kainate 2 [Drosophila rhopaloa]|uniref:Glutamate receptor ionotropic, kainate 2 n=1 Tax=Drosophila rhopaloa TaxID=1041015 RepID=A0A6P4ELS4_DRORH|nr:glutamate receptor ionotropic, kainate 2 [Drosophila rhopaloa]
MNAMHFCWILLTFHCLNKVQAQFYGGSTYGSSSGQSIRLGLITDDATDRIRQTFEHAISVVNNELGIPLAGETEQVAFGNSVQAFAQLCRLMQGGVGAVFGPAAKQTASHLLNACDSKDIPFIYPHLSWSGQVDGFNLHPSPEDIAHALYDIVNQFEWSRFIFCYESAEYLNILDHLMTLYGTKGPVIKVMRYDLNLNGNYKSVLRRIRKSEDSRIVVVGSTEGVAELLRQAQQVGIMNEDYTYVVGNLDLHTFELEEYKYSEANITGIRMFSPDQEAVRDLDEKLHQELGESGPTNTGSSSVTMSMALTYDAVRVIAETTKHLPYQPQMLNCSERHDNVQPDGSTFRNYMRSLEIKEKTITGRIYFEGNVRKGFTFDVIELQSSGLVKIGTWEEGKDFEFQRPPEVINFNDINDGSLVNKTFTVLISIATKPYASLVESIDTLLGNNQYQGYGVDLIKELADKLGFKFIFRDGGSDYGSFNKTTNTTTGMLKEIVEGRADLAITDLTITAEREEVIDFSIPFMNLGIAILYVKPQKAPPALFSFMDPFSSEVWLYLGIAYVGVSLCFFIIGRLSPIEWDNPYPCIEEPEKLENQFTINNSLWFTTGALLQQGSEIAPKALSTRTISAIWWFFTLIMVSSYTANLAAFLTIENPTSPINSVEDLADNKGEVQYGAKRTGSTRNFFLTSEDPTYMKMNEYMTSHPEMLMESNQDGVDKVKAGTKYAFLMESTSIEFNTVRECNLTKVGDALDEKGYGIAMVKNWPYRDKFNNALLELQEQGVLARLKNKWWNEVGAGVCSAKSGNDGPSELGVANLSGIYAVLAIGSCISMIVSILYWCYFVYKKAKLYAVPFSGALAEEFKIVIRFSENERVLKSAQSIYSRSRNSSQSIESLKTDSEENSPAED